MTLERHLATPLIITNQMDESEFKYEWERMKLRSQATTEFLHGALDVNDYLEVLREGGVDPFQVVSDWSNGQSYL